MLERVLTRPNLILLAAGGSAAMMIGALLFQYVGDMAPCKLCYWQRYPHIAAIGIGMFALMVPGRLFPLLGAIAALTTAGIGVALDESEQLPRPLGRFVWVPPPRRRLARVACQVEELVLRRLPPAGPEVRP